MKDNPHAIIQFHHDLITKIFKQKEASHRRRAELPIEEKIKILIELQKIALTIRPRRSADDPRIVWKIRDMEKK